MIFPRETTEADMETARRLTSMGMGIVDPQIAGRLVRDLDRAAKIIDRERAALNDARALLQDKET